LETEKGRERMMRSGAKKTKEQEGGLPRAEQETRITSVKRKHANIRVNSK